MAANRYVVLGLSSVRSVWFREVGKWSTAAAIPVDFIRCVSTEEVRARLTSGRSFSALLVDAGTPGIDRDLIDVALDTGAGVIVVTNGRSQRDWTEVGATAILPEDFHRGELMEELERHGRPLDRAEARLVSAGPQSPAADWSGRLIAVVGGSGAGSSTVAMGLAQGLADDPRYSDLTLLADMALNGDLAMLHDAKDIVPGLQEMVDAHRTGTPSLAELRTMVFEAGDRGYHLLLGLRRHRDWSALRPRAVGATIEGLTRSYRVVVADIEADLEGEDETGSPDVEERNLLARSVVRRADLVIAVGTPTMKGLHDVLRVINDLVTFGVEPARILPVLNQSARPRRARAEATSALGKLLAPISPHLSSPIHLPALRRMNESIRDNVPLPDSFTRTLASATSAMIDHRGPVRSTESHHRAVVPGSLGHFSDDIGGDPGQDVA